MQHTPQDKRFRDPHTGQFRELRPGDSYPTWCSIMCFGLIMFLVVALTFWAAAASADELVREGRYHVLDDQGQLISVHNELHVAIVNAQAWSEEHEGRTVRIEPPRFRVQVDPPEVVEPPVVDPGPGVELPTREQRFEPLKDASASDFWIDRPRRVTIGADGNVELVPVHALWFDDPGVFSVSNAVVSGVGGEGSVWVHGCYATRADVFMSDVWFRGPTRVESGGRDHLVLYASGCPTVTLRRVLIGHWADEFPHDFAIKIKSHDGEPDRVTRHVVIEDLVVFGGRRVLLSAGNDDADAGVMSAESITIRRLLWVDPRGDGGGRLEALRFNGVGQVTIEELVVIDTTGELTKPRLVVATDSAGTVSGRAYLPAALGDRPLVDGLAGEIELMDAPPAGERPPLDGPEDLDAWLTWAGIDTPRPPPTSGGGRVLMRPEFALAGDLGTIEYAYPGNLAGLYKLNRAAAEAAHGPIGPMRELIARRGTAAYQANLRGLVESAALHGRVLAWNVEPVPTADWSAQDRDEWMAGQLLLIADARSIDPAVEQAAYRLPYGDPVRESRLVYARDAAAGGSLAADAGLNADYWRHPERLPEEEAKHAVYLQARAAYAPVIAALDYVSVHGYQQSNYPPRTWAAVAFAEAAAYGKPILLWLSPKERGRSDTAWANSGGLRDLVALAELHRAARVLWVNGVDMADDSPEMRERVGIVSGGGD